MTPISIALTGIGNRALPKVPESSNFLGWVEQIGRRKDIELVAAHDPSEAARSRMTDRGLLPGERVFEDIGSMLQNVRVDALLVCSPGRHHAEALDRALGSGLHLLVEKPFVTDLDEGRRLTALAAKAGVVTTAVQNWRYKDVGRAIRAAISSGLIGRIGHVFFRYVRNRENPNYPAYIFQEQDPMLYAMGSHHLDLFRHVLGEEMTDIRGESFRAPWSMYESSTGHALSMRTESGVFVSYVGSISSMNSGLPLESLVIEGENGTLVNESDWSDPPLLFYPKGGKTPQDLTAGIRARSLREQYDVADAFILEDFVQAIAEGRSSDCPLDDSLRSLELVEACREACAGRARISLSPDTKPSALENP